MDLGIKGKTAIVCAASKGLGTGCAMALAREGLTGFIAGLSRKTVAHNVTINNILPGPFDTDRLRSNIAAQAKASGKPVEQVARERQAQNPAGRFGTAAEFGEVCAFICSAQAGYITGQNFVLDGGAYPGTL